MNIQQSNDKVSIIITAYKEAKSISGLIDSILNPSFQNIPSTDFEILVVCPDYETYSAAKAKSEEFGFSQNHPNRLIWVKDEHKGKPAALNLAFKQASGDIFILTDGDVVKLEIDTVNKLVQKIQSDDKLGGVTGCPVSADRRDTIFGYWGHLLAAAADYKREAILNNNSNSQKSVLSKAISHKVDTMGKFFVMSGYLTCIKKPDFEVPTDCLVDDAYISYKLKSLGLHIGYVRDAKVYIKYPTNLSDWYKQKVRSLGGYVQLYKYDLVNFQNKTRSFWAEIGMLWFPINFAKNLREFIWSLMLYPIRLWLWVKIFWDRKILNKSFEKSWVRVESTK